MVGIEDMMVNKIDPGFRFHGAHSEGDEKKKKHIDKIKTSCSKVSEETSRAEVENRRGTTLQ